MSWIAAYVAYLVGSAVFFGVAVSRGSYWVALGSVLFALGTTLLLVPGLRQRRREHQTACEQ